MIILRNPDGRPEQNVKIQVNSYVIGFRHHYNKRMNTDRSIVRAFAALHILAGYTPSQTNIHIR